MDRPTFEQPPHHLDGSCQHLVSSKSPPRRPPQIGLCKAVLPPSPVFKI